MTSMRWALVTAVVALVVSPTSAVFGASSAGPLPRIAAGCQELDFTSAGRAVRARLCLPGGASATHRLPGVIVLHGCGGFGALDEIVARELPPHGIATYYVDYFGLTPPPSRKGFCNAGGSIDGAFAIWSRIARDATRSLKTVPGIEPARVGAVGWSLGGGLALSTAEQNPHLFRALVLFSSFAHDLQAAGQLPPTLVLSGGSGDAVPVAEARALYQALRRAHVPSELRVYSHGNHQWKNAQGVAGERWMLSFLNRYLVR
jgi:dienelactone hydrolase